MSIAGDTQPRVPGFYSRPETILSPRKGGVFLAAAENPNYFTALQTSGTTGVINIGGTITNTGNTNVSIGGTIGSASNPGNFNTAIGGTIAGGTNSVAINGTVSSTFGPNIAIGGTIGGATQSGIAIGDGAALSFGTANPSYSIALGYQSVVNTPYSIGIGQLSRVDTAGEISFQNGDSGTRGDTRYSIIPCRRTTSDATPTELGTSDGVGANPTNRLICTNNTTYIYDVDIVVRNTANTANCAAYNLKFAFNRGANAAASTISPLSKTIIYTLGTTTGWDVTATADTTNGRPNISVTGAAATTLKWFASVKMTKVSN